MKRWYLKKKYRFTDHEIDMLGLKNEQDYKKYISQFVYRSFRSATDRLEWCPIVHNKLISKNYFSACGIKQPSFYGYYQSRDGFDKDGLALREPKDLINFLNKYDIQSFVMKHIGSGQGENVFIVKYYDQKEETFKIQTGEVLDLKSFVSRLDTLRPNALSGYLIEEMIMLHPELSELTAGGVSSARLVSLKDTRGNVSIYTCFVRFGLRNGKTDHTDSGSYYGKIDNESGKVISIYSTKERPFKKTQFHADSNKDMLIQMPYWNESKDLVLRAARITPGINLCGWDVVISNTGPVLIEGNVGVGIYVHQSLDGGYFANGTMNDWSDALGGLKLPDWSLRWQFNHSKLKRRLKRLIGKN